MKVTILAVVFSFVLAGAAEVPAMPQSCLPDPAVVVAAAAKATTARFPDADSVIVDDRIHTQYEADGSDITWDDEWIKVLTEKGRRSLAQVTFGFSERYGDAGILKVEIIGTNGVARTVDFAQTLKIATDNSSMGSNIYDPLDKEGSCAVPGLQVGEIRHVRTYRRTRKARMHDTWADMNLLELTRPILSTTISVDQPAARPVVHAVVRNPFGSTVTRAPDVKLDNGRTRLSWTATGVPQAFPEPSMPSFSRCVQGLRLSTIKDWPTVSRWYWEMCAPHLAKTTPEMTNQVNALVKNCTTTEAKIRALYKFVSQEVRYMGLTLEGDAPGYEPHDVNLTFENRYGVCRDKAALLAAMLRIAGVKAFPVLIHAGAKMDPDVPTPFFNHAIVGVELPGRKDYMLMDPTNESSKDLCPAYLSDKSFLVARPEGEKLLTSPVTPYTVNALKVASEGTLDAEGTLLLTTSFAFGGINDTAVRHGLVRKTPEERRRWFEGLLRALGVGAELLSLELEPTDLRDTETPLTAKTIARIPEFVLRGKTRDSFNLPFFTTVLNLANRQLDENTALAKRRFPLELSYTAGTEETLRLVMGDSVGAVASLPKDLNLTAGGTKVSPKYAFTRTVACEKGVLRASRKLALSGVDFTVREYADLRLARELAETGERDTPSFAARANDDANIRVLHDETIVHFQSPTAWVQTNIVEKEILTYQGKKSSSELKFTYAPSTRSVQIVSATVTNKDGKKFSVTPKEINEMDCGWASSAPRYPASKILVVNLPGVEIGSVIRTVVVRTVTKAPTAYAGAWTFGGRSPVDFEQYEYHVPNGMRFASPIQSRTFLKAEGRICKVVTNATERVFTWGMKNPAREPNEPSQPPSTRWRPSVAVSAQDWPSYGRELVDALAAARAAGSEQVRAKAKELVKDCTTPEARQLAIRTYLAHHLRVAGPGLFELPFDQAFTAPDTVLAEGYGSDADRMNLAFAMFEAAGFDCSYILAADDSHGFRKREKTCRALPSVGAFSFLLLRAVWRSGWMPFFRDEEMFVYGGENEFTPVNATAWADDSIYDPQQDTFGRIACASNWMPRTTGHYVMNVRENGAVDFTVTNATYGASVGPLRKQFRELLPENRLRFYQQLIANLAQNASATRELETDVEGYPFSLSFAAYAEGYAVVKGETISLELPAFQGNVFGLRGSARRRSPIAVGGMNPDEDVFEVVFPKGYTEIESLPRGFTILNPTKKDETWLVNTVTQKVVDGCLHVTISRKAARKEATQLGADYDAYLKDWNKRAASLEARTITVRRSK
ncbi:MAG: DUF3857 domain-containing protein [Kiritimatiellae bacterium]|nr:DUF3857 domain-containing protein [Kiritimatiellia bacterium]